MKILFLTRKGDGLVGAPHTYHEFEQAVGKEAECMWAGRDWPLYSAKESIDLTVKRVMPDADWVIVDKNKLERALSPKKRSYHVGVFISDLHGKFTHGIRNPTQFRDYLNQLNYDAFFLKYLEVHGCGVNPHLFEEGLRGKVFHLPWSIDAKKHNWRRKKHDVAFIGAVGETYPLRTEIYANLYHVARGYNIICCTSPRGKTFDRSWDNYENGYVGERYVDLLNETKIMIFGCSKYRYPVQKYFESTGSGCLVLSDQPSSAKKLGFIDGKTYADINTFDWETVLRYCLENYDSVKHIARGGLKNTLMNHSHEARAREFVEMLY